MMKTPEEVAAAQDEAFDELERRLGRFAWGADRSEWYARELRSWLAESYAGDPRFSSVLVALRDYRSKVGQEEAAQACRDVIQAVRADIEGPRFPWHGIPDEKRAEWRRVFSGAEQALNLGHPCPVCGSPTLRRYNRAYESGRGGLWEWCGNCFSYEHSSAHLADSATAVTEFDGVPMKLLEHSPEFLERAARLADAG